MEKEDRSGEMMIRFLVLAIRMFVLVFALHYVGFSSEQTLVLSLSIVGAMSVN